MENLVELVTYDDEEYGLVSQFLDKDDNTFFYRVIITPTGEKKYESLSSDINNILINKYFGMESDLDE